MHAPISCEIADTGSAVAGLDAGDATGEHARAHGDVLHPLARGVRATAARPPRCRRSRCVRTSDIVGLRRTHASGPFGLRAPLPAHDLGHVVAVPGNVRLVLQERFRDRLLSARGLWAELRHAADQSTHQVEASRSFSTHMSNGSTGYLSCLLQAARRRSPCDHARALHYCEACQQMVGVVLAADPEEVVDSAVADVAAGEGL